MYDDDLHTDSLFSDTWRATLMTGYAGGAGKSDRNGYFAPGGAVFLAGYGATVCVQGATARTGRGATVPRGGVMLPHALSCAGDVRRARD